MQNINFSPTQGFKVHGLQINVVYPDLTPEFDLANDDLNQLDYRDQESFRLSDGDIEATEQNPMQGTFLNVEMPQPAEHAQLSASGGSTDRLAEGEELQPLSKVP